VSVHLPPSKNVKYELAIRLREAAAPDLLSFCCLSIPFCVVAMDNDAEACPKNREKMLFRMRMPKILNNPKSG